LIFHRVGHHEPRKREKKEKKKRNEKKGKAKFLQEKKCRWMQGKVLASLFDQGPIWVGEVDLEQISE